MNASASAMGTSLQLAPAPVVFKRNGLALIESHHGEGFFMEWRSDPFPKLLLVVGGQGTLRLPDRSFRFDAPCVAVVPARQRHLIEDAPGHPLSLYGVCLAKQRFPGERLVRLAFQNCRVIGDSTATDRIQWHFRDLLAEERANRPESGDYQLGLVCSILVECIRTSGQINPGRVDSESRVAAYVDSLGREFWKDRDLDGVARGLALSRRRFTQIFRELTGESWLQRITRLRMDHAASLLRTTRLTVRSVAFECGFAELTHFYRVFKNRYRCSPSRWRELNSVQT